MSEKNFAVGDPIKVLYQAPNRQSGQTIVAQIYLPTGVKDSNFPDFTLIERGSSGTYVGEFTPDADGEWQIIISKDDGDGQVTKRYSVGEYNVDTVGKEAKGVRQRVDILEGKVDALEGKVDAIGTDVSEIDVNVDNVESKVDALDTKVDVIDTKVSALDTPPMVS